MRCNKQFGITENSHIKFVYSVNKAILMRAAHSNRPYSAERQAVVQQKTERECVDGHADDTNGLTRYRIIVNVAKVS